MSTAAKAHLFIAGCDAPERLELADEAFDGSAVSKAQDRQCAAPCCAPGKDMPALGRNGGQPRISPTGEPNLWRGLRRRLVSHPSG